MEVIVEVGTEEEKDAIISEINFIYGFLDECEPTVKLHQVIVPIDFQKTIRDLTGDKSYMAIRGQIVAAKTVNIPQGVSIVFSRFIYCNKQYDFQVRLIYYMHELSHAINMKRFRGVDTDSPSRMTYLSQIYILFDEYFANRNSFRVMDDVFKQKTRYLMRFLNGTFAGHVRSLLKDDYYLRIREEVYSFYSHNSSIKQFMNNLTPIFDEASKDIVYAFSYIDHFPRLKRIQPALNKSKIINKKTIALIELFRQKYEADDLSLEDGLGIMQNYMDNFGMRFKDTPEGLSCSVLYMI